MNLKIKTKTNKKMKYITDSIMDNKRKNKKT